MRVLPVALLLTAAVTAQQPARSTSPPAAPPELGRVTFGRDLDRALAASRATGRPVFLLFQEIPGCPTCTGFGAHVLSHPLLVPAIEREFLPVVVRNNVGGEEGAVRERFAEPAWNNPVVRLCDADGKDVIPRQDGIWDAHGIAVRLCAALAARKRPVPGYLQIARDESDSATARAVFTMHCFWEGEAVLGALDGVVGTQSAFANGAEVVEVTFLPARLPKAKLTEIAQAKSCRPVAGGEITPASAGDQQHALGGTPYARLQLTPMQRTKVHAALTLRQDPAEWLSPDQQEQLAALRAHQKH